MKHGDQCVNADDGMLLTTMSGQSRIEKKLTFESVGPEAV